jgi:hypothetical protein
VVVRLEGEVCSSKNKLEGSKVGGGKMIARKNKIKINSWDGYCTMHLNKLSLKPCSKYGTTYLWRVLDFFVVGTQLVGHESNSLTNSGF